MRVLVFPGNHKHNESMIADAQSKYDDVIGVRWSHWDGEEDREADYRRVVELMQANAKAAVVAKSYGGMLVMHALSEYLVANDPIIILGALPHAIKDRDLDLETIDERVRIVQNEHDPYGSYTQVAELFSDVKCIADNDTHDYEIPEGL